MTIGEGEEFRDTADEILSRPEFQEAQPSVVQRATDWIFEQLGQVLGGVVGSGGGYIIGYLILAVAATLAAYLVWKFFPRRRLVGSDDDIDIEHRTTVRLSRKEWLKAAAEAEAAGDWDRAVHARYHALTTGLADDEKLAPEPSTTSGEHRARFAAGDQADEQVDGDQQATAPNQVKVGVFNRATDRYEEVWFGGAEARQPDSNEFQEADRQLLDGDR